MQIEYFRQPTPHAFISELVAPEIYARIRFPDIPPRPMGRIGRDVYYGEPEWSQIMAQPGWGEFADAYMNEAFVRRIVGMFASDIRDHGCAIDPDKIYLAQRAESRQETESSHPLRSAGDRRELRQIGPLRSPAPPDRRRPVHDQRRGRGARRR